MVRKMRFPTPQHDDRCQGADVVVAFVRQGADIVGFVRQGADIVGFVRQGADIVGFVRQGTDAGSLLP